MGETTGVTEVRAAHT